ncbi:hypothetical protein AcV5_005437 [Taiwanofungus camphoratus]|nr:hypothetical protein AcV5_005437 [Antrodia cinnamomea]
MSAVALLDTRAVTYLFASTPKAKRFVLRKTTFCFMNKVTDGRPRIGYTALGTACCLAPWLVLIFHGCLEYQRVCERRQAVLNTTDEADQHRSE